MTSVSPRGAFALLALAILVTSSLTAVMIIHAASPASGTLSQSTTSVSWSGSTTTSDAPQSFSGVFNPTDCSTAGYCDAYSLTLGLPSSVAQAGGYTLTVEINWASGANDFDLYVYLGSSMVGASTLGAGTSETVILDAPPAATYTVYAVMSLAQSAPPYPYSGTASVVWSASNSSTLRGNYIDTGSKYANQFFGFSNDLRLQGAGYSSSSTTTSGQDAEPAVQVTNDGTIYVAAIQGVPSGVDFWKSTDGGNSFQYLGQPDGTQCGICTQNTTSVGLGGGDEDLKITSNGSLVLASLWLGSTTVANSANGGGTWVDGQTPIPVQDRPWIATVGPSTVYLYTRQLGDALTAGSDSLLLAESTNGGLTFTQGAAITLPSAANPAPPNPESNTHGPMTAGPDGTLYTVFTDSAQNLWLMKCPGPCNLPALPAGFTSRGPVQLSMIYNATSGPVKAASSVFPVVVTDSAGNLYVVFSDGNNVYLITSTDGGTVWDSPVQVNHGPETVSAVLPWAVAGSPGRLGIFWYGSNSTLQFSGEQWKAFYAFSPDAQTSTPTFYQVVASGGGAIGTNGVDHVGAICLMGLTCNIEGANRHLAEYSYVNIDPRTGFVVFTVSTDVNTPNGLAWQDFIKQTAGMSLFAPVPPVTITSLITLNGDGAPLSTFAPGQVLQVSMGLSVASTYSGTALAGVQIASNGQTFVSATLKETLEPGSTSVTFEISLPSSMPAGSYAVTGFVWNGFPSQKGSSFQALASPATAGFQVT